jgi:predicted molibdopterin-dependent oxidoreductase YjgC
MSMVRLTIDGIKVDVHKGTTILEAAEKIGIDIPTLCYHQRLPPIGSCNMCIVEVEGKQEPVWSCNTAVADGLTVTTFSKSLLEQRTVYLKKILRHHPLDCSICDAAGECELQDIVYEFGIDEAPFETRKEKRSDIFSTTLIRHWAERCIMCGRCAAACRDIKGIGVLAVQGEEGNKKLAVVAADKCISCGECLFVCPTGALTENLSKYKGRPWLVDVYSTTCTYCGCGCQLDLKVMDNHVIEVTTDVDTYPNLGSLCVKGRFGYEFIGDESRLKKPLIRENGALREASWEEALDTVAERFGSLRDEYGPDSLAGLSSAKATNEENYLFQKFMRAVIGTNNVDHCARL